LQDKFPQTYTTALEKSQKKFIKLPTLGGGREVLRNFIREHLRYPKEALENKIEGDVIIEYHVNGKGEVSDANVIHGIGYGCDAEALRLVMMLRYQAVKNRGMKVTTNNKIKIPFRLPINPKPSGIQMTYVPKATPQANTREKAQPPKGNSYTYTINI
jgi:TonB family protein